MTKEEQQRKKRKKEAGNWAFLISLAVLFLLFRPSNWAVWIIIIGVSVLLRKVIGIMAEGLDLSSKPQASMSHQQGATQRTHQDLSQLQKDTGYPDANEMLETGTKLLYDVRTESRYIGDTDLTEKIASLDRICTDIFFAIQEQPTKASQVRKLVTYYLPTALKLIKGYRMLNSKNVGSDEAIQTKKRIQEAIGVVSEGCQHLMDQLFDDDVLDLTTDIDVLEQMLKRDGLTESDLEQATQQAQMAAKLNDEVDALLGAEKKASDFETAKQKADTHVAQVPTMDGGVYTSYFDQATKK